jgi:hypothetical protein
MTQITKIGIYQRPNISVEFYPSEKIAASTQEYNDYIAVTYSSTGQLISQTIELSNNDLTKTFTQVWVSQEAYDQYQADPVVVQRRIERSSYNQVSGISETFI